MPYLIARTEEVEKALYLRQWGVPFEALAYVFGRDAMFWYRAWLAFGRPNLVGTTVKAAERMPNHLVVDEKITWLDGAEVSVPTTAGGGCVLGISLTQGDDGAALKSAYGEFAEEAAEVFPDYQPFSVCTDGSRGDARGLERTRPRRHAGAAVSCTRCSRSPSAAAGRCDVRCSTRPGASTGQQTKRSFTGACAPPPGVVEGRP